MKLKAKNLMSASALASALITENEDYLVCSVDGGWEFLCEDITQATADRVLKEVREETGDVLYKVFVIDDSVAIDPATLHRRSFFHGVHVPFAVRNANTVQDACRRLKERADLLGEDHPTTEEYRSYLRDWIAHAMRSNDREARLRQLGDDSDNS